jgi:hypothetical protein
VALIAGWMDLRVPGKGIGPAKRKADNKHLGWPVLNKDNTQTKAKGLEKVRGEEGGYNAGWMKNKIEKDEPIYANDGATMLRHQQQQRLVVHTPVGGASIDNTTTVTSFTCRHRQHPSLTSQPRSHTGVVIDSPPAPVAGTAAGSGRNAPEDTESDHRPAAAHNQIASGRTQPDIASAQSSLAGPGHIPQRIHSGHSIPAGSGRNPADPDTLAVRPGSRRPRRRFQQRPRRRHTERNCHMLPRRRTSASVAPSCTRHRGPRCQRHPENRKDRFQDFGRRRTWDVPASSLLLQLPRWHWRVPWKGE